MNNFEFYNPTKIIFGEKKIIDIANYIKEYTKTNNILLVISESCKQNGVLNIVENSLNENSIHYYIIDKIKPNPTLEPVYLRKKICLEHNIDFILAISFKAFLLCITPKSYFFDWGGEYSIIISSE